MAQQRYIAKSGTAYISPQDTPITEEEKTQIEAHDVYDSQLKARQTKVKPPSPSDKPAANIRTVNPKTGQVHMITPQEYESRVKGLSAVGEIFSSPFTGAAKVAHGLYGMVTGQHGAEEEPSEYPRLKAFSEAVRGVGEALTPFLYDVGIGAAFPAATKVVGLGGSFSPLAQAAKVAIPSMAAQKTVEFGSTMAGAPSEVATALGDVAGLGVGAGIFPSSIKMASASPEVTNALARIFPSIERSRRQSVFARLPERQLTSYANKMYDLLPSSIKSTIADKPQDVQSLLQQALPEIVAYFRKNPDFQLALEKNRPEDTKQVVEHFIDALDVSIAEIMGALKTNNAAISSQKIPVINPVTTVKNDLLNKKSSAPIADKVLEEYNIIDSKGNFIPQSANEWENTLALLNSAMRSIKQSSNFQTIDTLRTSNQEFRSIDRLAKTIRKQLGDFFGEEYSQSRQYVAGLRDVRDAFQDFVFSGRQDVIPEGVARGVTQGGFAASEAARAVGGGIPGVVASAYTKTGLRKLLSKDVNKALLDIIRKADEGDIGPRAPRPSTRPPKPIAELPEHQELGGPPRDWGTIHEGEIISEDPQIRGYLLSKNPPTAIITPPPGHSTLDPSYSGVTGKARLEKTSSAPKEKTYFSSEMDPNTVKNIQVELGPTGSWMNMLPQQIVREQPAGVMSVKPTTAGDKTGGLQVVYKNPNTGEKKTIIFQTKELADAFITLIGREFGR